MFTCVLGAKCKSLPVAGVQTDLQHTLNASTVPTDCAPALFIGLRIQNPLRHRRKRKLQAVRQMSHMKNPCNPRNSVASDGSSVPIAAMTCASNWRITSFAVNRCATFYCVEECLRDNRRINCRPFSLPWALQATWHSPQTDLLSHRQLGF